MVLIITAQPRIETDNKQYTDSVMKHCNIEQYINSMDDNSKFGENN